MPYVLMKVFEEAPRRFDEWMRLLTLGRLQEVREEIASHAVAPGAHVLDIGCGPGTLALLLAERGAGKVVGVDTSEDMLAVAEERLKTNGLRPRVEFKKLSALEIEDVFAEGTFDHVTGILVLSELANEEIDCVLQQCRRLLKSRGGLSVVDEVQPKEGPRRWFFGALRYPLRLVTFLVLQARDLKSSNIFKKVLYYVIEFPLMLLTFLVVPPASRPLSDLQERLQRAGFHVVRSKTLLAGTLAFWQAERVS